MSHDLRRVIAKLVVFVAFSLLLTTIVFATLLNSSAKGQRDYAADFVNGSGLRSGNSVRIAGVEVGKVTSVRLHDGLARVSFRLDDDQHPTDTTKAAINYANLLGQRFVNLLPGSTTGDVLPVGTVIPTERTTPGLDLTAVFNGFQPLFAALSPQEVNKLSASIVQVFQGQSGTVESLVKQTAVITTNLADRQQLIDSVLKNLASLLTQVGAHDAQLGSLIDQFDVLLTGLAGNRETLGNAVTGVSALTTDVAGLLHQSQPALDADITRLSDVTDTLAQQQAGLDGTIQGLPGILATFTKPISTGSYLNTYLCNLTVNISPVVGNPGDNRAGPLIISLVPGVPASPSLYPGPVTLPARTVAGASSAGTAVCR